MLVSDRVVNVRVTLAKVMSELFINKSTLIHYNLFFLNFLDHEWTLKNDDLNKIAFHLKSDANKNVHSLFKECNNIKEMLYTEDELGESNSLFLNRMTILKEEFGITRNLPVNAKPCEKSILSRRSTNSSLNSSGLDNSINNISADEEPKNCEENESEASDQVEQVEDNSDPDESGESGESQQNEEIQTPTLIEETKVEESPSDY